MKYVSLDEVLKIVDISINANEDMLLSTGDAEIAQSYCDKISALKILRSNLEKYTITKELNEKETA